VAQDGCVSERQALEACFGAKCEGKNCDSNSGSDAAVDGISNCDDFNNVFDEFACQGTDCCSPCDNEIQASVTCESTALLDLLQTSSVLNASCTLKDHECDVLSSSSYVRTINKLPLIVAVAGAAI